MRLGNLFGNSCPPSAMIRLSMFVRWDQLGWGSTTFSAVVPPSQPLWRAVLPVWWSLGTLPTTLVTFQSHIVILWVLEFDYLSWDRCQNVSASTILNRSVLSLPSLQGQWWGEFNWILDRLFLILFVYHWITFNFCVLLLQGWIKGGRYSIP